MLESLSNEELTFIKAIEKYKAEAGKNFLSWTEVLKIFKDLGYQKVARRTDIVVGPSKSRARKSSSKESKTAKSSAKRTTASSTN